MKCEIVSKFFSTVNELSEKMREPKDYGFNETLNLAELNFIDAVYFNPEANSIKLSKALNVTKGAISQWGKSLESKGLVSSFFMPNNKKDKYFKLTELGEKVRLANETHHYEGNNNMCKFLSGLNDSERDAIIRFLENISKNTINDFECMSNCEFIRTQNVKGR